jgi:hypothetical protein
MTGINRNLTLDTRHIPNTPEMLRLLNKEGFVHVFGSPVPVVISKAYNS